MDIPTKLKHIDYAMVAEPHTPMYLIHKYWARKPHNVVAAYIKNYSQEGEIVLDPFSGSGVTAIEAIKSGRKGIAIDLNPVATFITRQTAIPADIAAITQAFSEIQKACKEQIEALYETSCKKCKTDARVLAMIWDRDKDQPVELRYFCPACNKRAAKKLDAADKALLQQIEKKKVPHWYPTTKLSYNSHPYLKQETADSIDKLFTKRNLIAISILYHAIGRITDPKIQDLFKFTFTSMVHLASKMCPIAKPSEKSHWSEYSATSFWAVQSYWVPPLFMESNVWMLFGSAVNGVQGLINGKSDSNSQIPKYREAKNFKDFEAKANIFIRTHNALELLQLLPPESVDYIFTDPPYGGAVQYFELSTLWASWLQMDMDWWKDEVTINDEQSKTFDYYHKMLHAGFLQMLKVLKPGKWMTVTFHSTDIKVYNSIIQAAVFAGFNLEKIVYQPPARASAKGLLQPYGSAVGDYYIRFRKPEQPKKIPKPTEVNRERYENVVVQIAEKIIAERGEPTAYTHILNGIYPELDRYGLLLSATEDPKQVLEKHLNNEFVLINVPGEKGKVIGKKWWLKDLGKAKINLIPLHERVEKVVINVLNSKIIASFDDIQQELFIAFPNSLTPEKQSIQAILEQYADHSGAGRWRLKTRVQQRLKQHARMVFCLADLGSKAGYEIWIGAKEQGETYEGEKLGKWSLKTLKLATKLSPEQLERIEMIDVLWLKNGTIDAAFEVENTTTITEAVVRVANIPYDVHKVILIPSERENLLARKLQEPGLQTLGIQSWRFIFYDDLLQLHGKHKGRRRVSLEQILGLNHSPTVREVTQTPLDLFPEKE